MLQPKAATKDNYKVLEVDYDVTDEKIRLNYRMQNACTGYLSILFAMHISGIWTSTYVRWLLLPNFNRSTRLTQSQR